MLFQAADEVRQYLPQNAEFEFEKLESFIKRQGEPHLIKPHLGKALFDKLDKQVTSNTYSSQDMEDLLDKVRFPLANIAYLYYIPFAQVDISKAGIHINTTDTRKTAFEWQIDDLKQSCMEAAYDGIEDLLLFLEENINVTDFADWKTSSAYTTFKECFINTAQDFSKCYNIGNSRRTFLAMKELMQEIEDTRIVAVLGQDYFDELKLQINGLNMTTANKKVLKNIQRATANLTIAKAMTRLPVRISGQGVQLMATSHTQTVNVLTPAETARLSAIIKEAEESGENYLKLLNDFLYANIDDYPTFKDSDVYVDPEGGGSGPIDQAGKGIVLF